ncbi:MAG: methionine--tRNA ligase [Brevinemataceae bacterium]
MEKYLVTSALPYANGPLHVGHLAGAYLPADIFVRSRRLNGDDVVYICGTDEHGVPITLRAESEQVSPREIVDRYHKEIKEAFDKFNIKFDNFSGTARSQHEKLSQEFFLELIKNDHIIVKDEEQFYDEQAEKFLPDRYVEGTCPKCSYDMARGDQCDKCGTLLTPFELVNPRSSFSGAKPIIKTDRHWYLKLQDFESTLAAWIESQKTWKDNVTKFILGWIKAEGLHERAITRSLNWGIPVPLDTPDAKGKVLYVWFDAPIGYISSTMEWAHKQGNPELWKKYWKDPETKLIHFIGKDNIPFHAVIWPSILMGQKSDWILPYDIPANEYLNLEGEKISTSQNWAVWASEAVKDFPSDTLRYALAANAPESKDADFTWSFFQARNNDELANIYGNLVNRTITFVHKQGGIVPEAQYTEKDLEHFAILENILYKLFDAFKHYKVRESCKLIMDIAREGNRYFDEMKPWELAKNDSERLQTVLNVCLNTLRILAFASYSVIPEASEKLWAMLGQNTPLEDERVQTVMQRSLQSGQHLGTAEILFRKIEDAEISEQIQKLNRQSGRKSTNILVPESKPEVTIEDFMKLDLRVAEITNVEVPEKSRKLLKLTIQVGNEQRQIMAGIKEFFTPQQLIGKKIVVVYNLKPAKLAGELSQGMLLAASTSDKSQLCLIDPGDIPSGMTVG